MVENDLEDNKRIRDRFASMPKTDELREAMEALEQQIAEQEEAEGELVGKPISKKGGSAIG
jgi:hypothetical protein